MAYSALTISWLHIGGNEDRPVWMGKVGFSDLRMKLIGVIVAISAVELLKAFLVSYQMTGEDLGWDDRHPRHLRAVRAAVRGAGVWISEQRKADSRPKR